MPFPGTSLLHPAAACDPPTRGLSLVPPTNLLLCSQAAPAAAVTFTCYELITSMLFFMNTLSISHPKLERQTRDLQKVVGIGCLDFLNMYAELLVFAHAQGKSKICALSDLYPPAVAVVTVSALIYVNFSSLSCMK